MSPTVLFLFVFPSLAKCPSPLIQAEGEGELCRGAHVYKLQAQKVLLWKGQVAGAWALGNLCTLDPGGRIRKNTNMLRGGAGYAASKYTMS